tara:strand:+ start:86 stop:1132 length:1047 start_codon:yes stop_codon:yes gene_type:complete
MKNFFNNLDHTFIIAEAGSNWKAGSYEEDIEQAHQLIKIAAHSGADAIKFQTYRTDTVYVENAGSSDYLSKHNIKENINDLFEYLSMPYDMIPKLSKFCKEENILFMSTPFSVNDAKEIDPFVQIHKVASFELNHIRLIEFLAQTKKPIILSTGASTYDEIDFAIKIINNFHNDVSLLQCTSKYPSPIEALNLNIIPKMKSKYGITIGFSDHSMDPVIGPTLAIGLGAQIIEKHFTLDKNLRGPDHKFALNPTELNQMISSIRNAEKAKGHDEKKVFKDEEELQKFAKRSIQCIKEITKGDILKEGYNFDILRPGKKLRGVEPRYLLDVEGKKSTKDVPIGEGILDYE